MTERRQSTRIILVLASLCLTFAFVGILGGIFGHAWWVQDLTKGKDGGRFEWGILRYCHEYKNGTRECGFRHTALQFKRGKSTDTNGDHRDILLLCLIIAAFFSILTLISMIFLCQMSETSWESSTLVVTFFVWMGTIPSIAGMIYGEFKFEHAWAKSFIERIDGWSYMLAWIGTGFLFISAIFSFILMFMKPGASYLVTKSPTVKKNYVAKRNTAFVKDDPDEPIQTAMVKGNKRSVIVESSL